MCLYIHVCMYVCMYVCVCMCVCMYVHVCSARNKDQKLVGRFFEDRIFYRLLTAVPLKMYGKFD